MCSEAAQPSHSLGQMTPLPTVPDLDNLEPNSFFRVPNAVAFPRIRDSGNDLKNKEWMRDPDYRPIRIAYPTSGTPTATLISDDKAVLDETLYRVTCRNLDEAHYLLAIINSDRMAISVNQFMPKGLFGARDLDKHLWKRPIPEYDPNEAAHADLSRLGKRAAIEAEKVIADIGTPPPSVTKARSILRHQWQPNSPTAQRIETAVQQLLA